jgi:hypothetical protein
MLHEAYGPQAVQPRLSHLPPGQDARIYFGTPVAQLGKEILVADGEQMPQSDPDEPSPATKPEPSSSSQLVDPGDFPPDVELRSPAGTLPPSETRVDPRLVDHGDFGPATFLKAPFPFHGFETRADDPGDFSSDPMPTEE